MKNFANQILKYLENLLGRLISKAPIIEIIVIAFCVLFILIFRCIKGFLQWLKEEITEEITIVEIIIIAFFVLYILIFRRLPNIDPIDLQLIGIIVMLGTLIFVFFSVVKAERKKQEKTENKKTDKTPN